MSVLVIPTRGDLANYNQSVELEGVVLNFRFRYNSRDECWYFSIYDVENNPIREGIKMVPNYALLRLLPDADGRPLGDLVVVDVRAVPLPPELAELGTVLQLTYRESDE